MISFITLFVAHKPVANATATLAAQAKVAKEERRLETALFNRISLVEKFRTLLSSSAQTEFDALKSKYYSQQIELIKHLEEELTRLEQEEATLSAPITPEQITALQRNLNQQEKIYGQIEDIAQQMKHDAEQAKLILSPEEKRIEKIKPRIDKLEKKALYTVEELCVLVQFSGAVRVEMLQRELHGKHLLIEQMKLPIVRYQYMNDKPAIGLGHIDANQWLRLDLEKQAIVEEDRLALHQFLAEVRRKNIGYTPREFCDFVKHSEKQGLHDQALRTTLVGKKIVYAQEVLTVEDIQIRPHAHGHYVLRFEDTKKYAPGLYWHLDAQSLEAAALSSDLIDDLILALKDTAYGGGTYLGLKNILEHHYQDGKTIHVNPAVDLVQNWKLKKEIGEVVYKLRLHAEWI